MQSAHTSAPAAPHRRNGFVAWLALALVLVAAVAQASDRGAREYAVKAAFLYNFTKFVEWPPESLGGADNAFVIGVLDCELLRAELEKAVQGRKVNGRPVVVEHYRSAAEIRSPHALFVGESTARRAEVFRRIADRPVLTVGESEEFLEDGGAIAFVFEEEKLRFAIDIGGARRARLRISAQLQKLAQFVHNQE